MIVGTTPTHSFSTPCKASDVAKVRVLYSQDDVLILTKTDCTIEDNQISVTLTQEDTFLFNADTFAEVQVRILTTSNDLLESIPVRFGITKCLENEVLI